MKQRSLAGLVLILVLMLTSWQSADARPCCRPHGRCMMGHPVHPRPHACFRHHGAYHHRYRD